MNSKQFLESTTSGAIASVSTPVGKTQTRGKGVYPNEKGGNLLTGKKTNKKHPNSVSESDKLKGTPVVDLKDFDDEKDYTKDKYGRTVPKKMKKDDPRTKFYKDGKEIKEAKLDEEDVIIVPGQGNRIKPGFIPRDKDRTDHEVEMAKSDLFQANKNAKKIYELIKDIPETVGIEGWVQEKIIKANDYLNTVREYLEHKELSEDTIEGKRDNFTIDDIKALEKIRDLETIKARAKELVKGFPDRRMKAEKIDYFYNRIDRLASPIQVIKLMYDLLLAGEGMKTIGSRYSTSANTYQRRFDEMTGGVIAGGGVGEGVAEGSTKQPRWGYHIVDQKTGNAVPNTPKFKTRQEAQQYLRTQLASRRSELEVDEFQMRESVAEGEKKLVKDRKTGEMYDPDEEFKKLQNDPEYIAQMKRMGREEGRGWPKRKDNGVAEGYILKKTNVDKYMEPGDPDEYTQDINIKDTDYEIINNKTGQVVGTASWTTNDYFGPGALKITMKNGATRYLDIWASEKGNPQSAFNRFVKDPKTAKKYKDQGVAEGYRILPPIDKERYGDRSYEGLEGPFRARNGKVYYYDPKAGMAYDPDTDIYIDYDELKMMDTEMSEGIVGKVLGGAALLAALWGIGQNQAQQVYSNSPQLQTLIKYHQMATQQGDQAKIQELERRIENHKTRLSLGKGEVMGDDDKPIVPSYESSIMKGIQNEQYGDKRDFKRREMEHELGHETNNYAVVIDGRQWKVFADKRQAENIARSLKNKGKNASVRPTSASVSESKIPDKCPECGGKLVAESELNEEGNKDACYHKVKSRYKVWPSAYASGALVKCRKVGASNWGNKKK